MTIGALGTPEYYMETRYALNKALMDSAAVIDEVFKQFAGAFGRKYERVTKYLCDDADVIFVTMGSMTGTARVAVDRLRARGKKAGLVKISVLRPFPFKELKDALRNTKVVAVTERAISLGYGGAIFGELAGHFVNDAKRPVLSSFIIGLGGRDVLPEHFDEIYAKSEHVIAGGKVEEFPGWAGLNREVL
jgi:pyruvate ferredoxin oxidoreductase alpha subunit